MIDYQDNIWILCQWRGSVAGLGVQHALLATLIALVLDILEEVFPDLHDYSGVKDSSTLWNAMVSVMCILLAFRIKQALGRFWEGTSLLHQMRGEWFDAASCLITFSRDAKLNKNRAREVHEFRATLVRLMSLMHGSALDEISTTGEHCASYYQVIDVQGLDTETLLFLRDCQATCNFSKVEALQHLVQVLVTQNHHKGILTIPPPILSRVYQSLSRGFVNLLNARKIKDTRFPFPFAQTIKILFVVHTVLTPLMMTIITDTKAWAAIFTFIFMFGLSCLNCIAEQLEMPFGLDSNDLPLVDFQKEFNWTLLMLVDTRADHMPRTSSTALQELTVKSLGAQFNHTSSMDCMNGELSVGNGVARSASRRSSRTSMSLTTSDLQAAVNHMKMDSRRPSINSVSISRSGDNIGMDFLQLQNLERSVDEISATDTAISSTNLQSEFVEHSTGRHTPKKASSSHVEAAELNTDHCAAIRNGLAPQLDQLMDLVRISSALDSCRSNTLERIEKQLADLLTRMEDAELVGRGTPTYSPRCFESPRDGPRGVSSPRAIYPLSWRERRPQMKGLDSPAIDLEAIGESLRQAEATRIGAIELGVE